MVDQVTDDAFLDKENHAIKEWIDNSTKFSHDLTKERYQYLVDNVLTMVDDMISTNDYFNWIQKK